MAAWQVITFGDTILLKFQFSSFLGFFTHKIDLTPEINIFVYF